MEFVADLSTASGRLESVSQTKTSFWTARKLQPSSLHAPVNFEDVPPLPGNRVNNRLSSSKSLELPTAPPNTRLVSPQATNKANIELAVQTA
jgi:hypothetical protein